MSASAAHRGRSRRGGDHDEEHVNHERWLVSYSDMITVLMALFIVLFAISQVDQDKYVALRDSLAAGFQDGTVAPSVLEGSSGTMDGTSVVPDTTPAQGTAGMVSADSGLGMQAAEPVAQPVSSTTVDPEVLAAAEAEAAHLEELQARIAGALTANGLDGAVRFRIDERGLVLGLVADDVFFAPASAEMTDTARRVLDVAGPSLAGIGEQISVEGHANTIPVAGRYATNWELSADRATQVLRHLVEVDGVPGGRIMAIGFGDTRPLVADSSPEALVQNRRVDLVVLSAAPEQVRALVPVLTAKG